MSRQYEQQEAVEQGMHLEGNANELARCIAEFKERHAALTREIEEEENKKTQIQADIQILTKRLASINESLSKKIEERNASARVVNETEAAYSKILESSQTLLAVVKRESAALRKRRQPT